MRRSSGPTQSGWRLAERWSMPGGQRAHGGHPLVHLLAEQHAAAAGLGALPDHDLDRVGLAQVGRVEAVARREHLVDEQRRGLALLGGHAAVAGGGRGADLGGGPPERLLGRGRQRAEAHAGDGDRDVELERLGAVAGAEHGRGLAALAVALERVARHRRREEDEVVEGGELAAGAEPADRVLAGLGHLVDPGDDLGREGVVLGAVAAGWARGRRGLAAISRRRGCGWRSGRAGGPRPPWSPGPGRCGRSRCPRPGA